MLASRRQAVQGTSELTTLDELAHTRTRVVGSTVVAPCASPWFYALFVALFASEWWLRRRFGLG